MSDIFTLYNKTSDDDMDVMTLKECFASQVSRQIRSNITEFSYQGTGKSPQPTLAV